jgi:hypothetical protein
LRRFSAASAAIPVLFLLAFALAGCGNSTTAPVPTSIQITPASASLTFGAVQPIAATVMDANNNVIPSATIVFNASSPVLNLTNAAVSQGTWFTTACAGVWNDSQLLCQPGNTPQAVVVTAASGDISATTTVYVHPKVDRVVVTPASVNCESQTHTHPFQATVFGGGKDITSSIGAVTWNTPPGQSVVTIDDHGIATAGQPGKSSVFASVSGVTSLPSSFITCPVQTIRVHVQNSSDTSFSLVNNASTTAPSQQLSADAVDTSGNPVNPGLTWTSSTPNANSVGSGLVTGIAGFSSITATCLPPACNNGLDPAYGNAVLAHTSGNLTPTLYAAGANSTSLLPVDLTDNTPRPAVTLPANPNSMLITPAGDTLYLGSDQGLMKVDASSLTVINNTSITGKVLAVSQDGRAMVASATEVFLVSSTSVETLAITGATAGAFSIQNSAYIVAGSKLYIHTPGTLPLNTVPPFLNLPGNGTAVDFLATGALGFAAQDNSTITAVSNCRSTVLQNVGTTGISQIVAPLPDGSGVLSVSPTAIDRLSVSPAPPEPLSGCPPSANFPAPNSSAFSGTLTPRQLIVLPDNSKAYLTSDQPNLQVYDITSGALSTIPLNGGASAYGGAALVDASTVYVGGIDSAIHVIDVASGKDSKQIPAGFVPNFLAVK